MPSRQSPETLGDLSFVPETGSQDLLSCLPRHLQRIVLLDIEFLAERKSLFSFSAFGMPSHWLLACMLSHDKWAAIQFSSVTQSRLTLCDSMECTQQASLSITNSWSLPKLMSIKSVMPSNHLILCRPLLLLSFPASGSFLMSHFFASGDHCIGTSASVSVLPMNIQELLLGIPYVWWVGSNCSKEFSLVFWLWIARCESLWVYSSRNLFTFSDIFHQIWGVWGHYFCRYSFCPSPLCVCWSLLVSRVSLSSFISLSVPQSGNVSWRYSFMFAGSTLFPLRSALEPLREFLIWFVTLFNSRTFIFVTSVFIVILSSKRYHSYAFFISLDAILFSSLNIFRILEFKVFI